MLEKDPKSYSLLTYGWVICLSVFGGIVNYLRKIENDGTEKPKPFVGINLLIEMTISGFVGVITFWLCEQADIAPLLTAALVGISGNMGSRTLMLFEDVLKKKIL